MADKSPLYEAVAKKFGDQKAAVFFEVAHGFPKEVFLLDAGPSVEKGVQGFAVLGAFLQGKAPRDAVPTALDDGLGALMHELEQDPQLFLEADDRPRVDGLPGMLNEVAQAKEEVGAMLPMVRARPEDLRKAAADIEFSRAVFPILRTHTRVWYCNLISRESKGAELVRSDYDAARDFARKNAIINPKLTKTEEYFFGPAAVGAKTAKENRARDEERQGAIQAMADDTAAEKARVLTAERLKAFSQSMNKDLEEAAPEPKPATKRKNPR